MASGSGTSRSAQTDTGLLAIHTLRHKALSRMVEAGYDDYTVMEISDHSSTRMLARYAQSTDARKQGALESFSVVTNWSHEAGEDDFDPLGQVDGLPVSAVLEGLGSGGPHGARTHDLRVANAALSQLS